MGVCSSIIVPNEDVDDNTMSESRNSRGSVVGFRKALTISEAKNSYLIEGSLAVDSAKSEVEFRTLLDYPVAREYFLSALAEHRPALQLCFLGWLDIRLYSSLTNGDVMSQLGASIIQKYIRPPALTDEDLAAQITAMAESRGFYASLFDSVQICFLRELHDEMFVPFKQSVHFKEMTASIKKKYNRVRVSDFEYLSVLGKGTYGIVVKVRKRSTGTLYAMKLQRKENMAERFGEDRWHVNFEKQAFASLRHPFIVELFYALQTKTLAILTMSLGSGKDLSSILRQNGPLSKKQVLFYSAEITSALSYLHHKGFIYRDLKPGNILLNADGHIQLVDFGAVCDLKGKTLAVCNNAASLAPVFAQVQAEVNKLPPLSQAWAAAGGSIMSSPPASVQIVGSYYETGTYNEHTSIGLTLGTGTGTLTRVENNSVSLDSPRARSLVGTLGYMAPEMVKMFLVEAGGWSLEGYTKAVDWWSLGVTMYKLLLSDYPFKVDRRELDVDDPVLQQEQLWHRYAVLLEEVDYRELSSDPDLVDLLSSLLCVEESRRLGYGHTGSADIGFHPYFKTINWMDLEQKNLPPPPLPSCVAETVNLDSKPPTAQYLSLSHLLTKIGYGYWLKFGAGPGSKECNEAKLAPREIEWLQEPFENWDYISPAAVVAEQIAARAGAHV